MKKAAMYVKFEIIWHDESRVCQRKVLPCEYFL